MGLRTKPTTGGGGLMWGSDIAIGNGFLLNVEATYKAYRRAGGTYGALTVASGTPVAPANGDVITVTDTGTLISVSVNGGAAVTYARKRAAMGPYVAFRNSSGAGMIHEAITITDT
jgi:hypothetical protein